MEIIYSCKLMDISKIADASVFFYFNFKLLQKIVLQFSNFTWSLKIIFHITLRQDSIFLKKLELASNLAGKRTLDLKFWLQSEQ